MWYEIIWLPHNVYREKPLEEVRALIEWRMEARRAR